MVQCLMKTNEIRQGNHMEEDDDDSHLNIEKLLETLTLRLLKCELEDFALVRIADHRLVFKDCLHVVFLAHFLVSFFIVFLASTGSNGDMKNGTKNARNGFRTRFVKKNAALLIY